MKSLKLIIIVLLVPVIFENCSSTENTETQQQSTSQELTSADTEGIAATAVTAEESTTTPETNSTSEATTQAETMTEPNEKDEVKPSSSTSAAKEEVTTIESSTPATPQKSINTESEPVEKPIAKTTAAQPTVKVKKPSKPSHDAFNTLLKKYVNASGEVNYAGFKKQKGDLDNYLKDLEENYVQNNWTRSEQMAYWINLYNAATIKLILDNYPVSSIRDINAGKPWDKRWIKVGSKTYTLNEIENSILRPKFADARIHFAVNCAAKSCPRLMNQAFTASNLNKLLDENARWFINNSTFNSISAKSVKISKIFEWYSADFGNIIDYLNKYSTTTIKSNAKVTYEEYNWDLNKM